MSVWSTPQGRVIWKITGDDGFADIDPVKFAVRLVHSAGATSSEDDLYEWTYHVQDGALVKHMKTTTYGEAPETRLITTIPGLQLLEGEDAARWERTARELYAAYQEGRIVAANAEEAAKHHRAATFLAALPEDCAGLVFRSVPGGWSVSLEGATEPLWVETDWSWRGKDLHYELQRVLARSRVDIESFGTELPGTGEQMAYYGE